MQADVYSGRKRIAASQRNNLSLDREILVVNFVHIIHLAVSKRQEIMLNFQKSSESPILRIEISDE